HQSDPMLLSERQQFTQRLEVSLDDKLAVMHGRLAIRVKIHPTGSQFCESSQAELKFLDSGPAQRFERAAQRQVIGGVTDHAQPVIVECQAYCGNVQLAHVCCRWFKG